MVTCINSFRSEVYREGFKLFYRLLDNNVPFEKADAERWRFVKTHKYCWDCKDVLPANLTYFYKNSISQDGLGNRCIKCHKLRGESQ